MAGLALAAGALPAIAAALPNVLLTSNHAADATVYDLTGTLATDTDPWLADAPYQGDLALADLGAGTLKGRASIADAPGNARFAASSFTVLFENTSGTVARFAADDLKLDVNASFSSTLGTDPSGTIGHTLTAILIAVVVDQNGQQSFGATAAFDYTNTYSVGNPAHDVRLTPVEDGGFTCDCGPGTYDAQGLDVTLHSSAFEVQPGEALGLSINLAGTATAFSLFGGTGFSAATDFANSAHLSLTLPAGFVVQSDVPLPWVSVTPAVPEPGSALLWLGGLSGLAAWQRRNRRRIALAAAR